MSGGAAIAVALLAEVVTNDESAEALAARLTPEQAAAVNDGLTPLFAALRTLARATRRNGSPAPAVASQEPPTTPNRFGGRCDSCRTYVRPLQGLAIKDDDGKWRVYHHSHRPARRAE